MEKGERPAGAGLTAYGEPNMKKLGQAYRRAMELAMRFWFWQRDKAERIYDQTIFFAARESCYLCTNCDTVGASSMRCPSCQSSALVNLSRFIKSTEGGARLVAS
jgi:uncharacterized paraquat-inducible protein A